MPSTPPHRTVKDVDTLPDGGAIITDDGVFAPLSDDSAIDASESGDGVPILSGIDVPNMFGPELDVELSERKTDPTEMPLRRNFDEEPTRKALAPKKLPKTEKET